MKPPSRPPVSAVFGAVTAFSLWGVLPIYWKALTHIDAWLAVSHRVVWTLATVVPLLAYRGEWSTWTQSLRQPRILGIHAWSALLLGINWSVFVWAAYHHRILDSSLGYFLNPLLNVAIGCVMLGERLRPTQAACIALAAAGVAVQIIAVGHVPWIALVLAGSFGFYALARRQSPLGSMTGLATETLLSMPVSVLYFLWSAKNGEPIFGPARISDVALLLGLGAITATPLLGFAHAARKLPFSLLGLLQFLAPTGQFLVGAFVYDEPVSTGRLASFACIWLAVGIYCVDLWRQRVASEA